MNRMSVSVQKLVSGELMARRMYILRRTLRSRYQRENMLVPWGIGNYCMLWMMVGWMSCGTRTARYPHLYICLSVENRQWWLFQGSRTMMAKERSFTKTFFIFQFILSVYKNGNSSLRPGPFIVQISIKQRILWLWKMSDRWIEKWKKEHYQGIVVERPKTSYPFELPET